MRKNGRTIVYDWFDDNGVLIYRDHYKVKDQEDYYRVMQLIKDQPKKYVYVTEY